MWTNQSIVDLCGKTDPLGNIAKLIRKKVLDAMSAGWDGPPFDPASLATLWGIDVVPSDDIADACVVSAANKGYSIHYNPNRPHARIRFSVAHEIVHTLFPDCHRYIRYRQAKEEMRDDDWQLELLCNFGASEILMPIGSFSTFGSEDLTIKNVVRLRKKFDVSTEAVLLRLVKTSTKPCAAFCASVRSNKGGKPAYSVDYFVPSFSLALTFPPGTRLPEDTVVKDCTAISFTAIDREKWAGSPVAFHIECVGLPPYPGQQYPRVVGIARPDGPLKASHLPMKFVVGDVLRPRGSGKKIIAHVVNDRAKKWGAGFGKYLQLTWPDVQKEFENWAISHPDMFRMGSSKLTVRSDDCQVFHMICQKGYGAAPRERIRYGALQDCLESLRQLALTQGATIHMPRIGTGQAGGSWTLVEELIRDILCKDDISVTVYDLPTR